MDPIRKIEIEPLSDPRWARIEKGLFAQLDREQLDREPLPTMAPQGESPRAWRWRPAVALVMAGAMAAGVGALATKSLFPNPTGAAPAASAASRVVTGSSDSHVALGESDVDVAPNSAVAVSGDDERGINVVVDRGKVECDVAPRKGRPPFVVQAGDVRVKVVGTHFTVERDAQGMGAHVLVAHGIVEVTSHGQTTTLHDGETWPKPRAESTPIDTPIDTAPPAPAPREALPASAHPRAASRPRSKSAPAGKTAIARGTASPASDPPATGLTASPPSLNLPPPQAPAPAVVAPEPVAAPAPVPAGAPAGAPAAQASSQELYESAAQLEAQNPDGALATYKKLAGGGGAWAANALFAAGRLQAHRGRNADAARLLDEYLLRFPNGANAADARELRAKVR